MLQHKNGKMNREREREAQTGNTAHWKCSKTLEILSEARAEILVYCRQSPTLDVSHHRYQTAGKKKKKSNFKFN